MTGLHVTGFPPHLTGFPHSIAMNNFRNDVGLSYPYTVRRLDRNTPESFRLQLKLFLKGRSLSKKTGHIQNKTAGLGIFIRKPPPKTGHIPDGPS